MTIRHIVAFKFKPSITHEQRMEMFARLDGLQGHLPGMLNCTYGRSVSPENLEHGFTYAAVMDFVDAVARDAYLDDAEHKRIGTDIVAALEGGTAGLVVCDIEI